MIVTYFHFKKPSFHLLSLSLWMFLIFLSNISCSEDYEKNSIRPEFEVIDWDIPNSYKSKLRYSEPLGACITRDNRYLICNYYINAERLNASAICIVDLVSGKSRWSEAPYWARIQPVSENLLAVYSTVSSGDARCTGYFLNIDSLIRTSFEVAAGGFINSSADGQVLALRTVYTGEQRKDDIWLFYLPSGRRMVLPASQHGLFDVRLAVSDDRLIISGETSGYGESFDRIRTQLWKLPELEKISEYETTERIPWKVSYKPLVLGNDSFCFAHAVGLRKVASLSKGVVRFSIGQLIPEKAWLKRLERGEEGDPILVLYDTCYVEETGRFVCLESFTKKQADIKTYDIMTGKESHSVTIPYEYFEFINVAKVAGEWIILCGWIDPEEEPAPDAQFCGPRKMWIVPYRLKDLAKAGNSIEIVWSGLHEPEITDGKLISVMTDHALIYDLSSIVKFGANQDNK